LTQPNVMTPPGTQVAPKAQPSSPTATPAVSGPKIAPGAPAVGPTAPTLPAAGTPAIDPKLGGTLRDANQLDQIRNLQQLEQLNRDPLQRGAPAGAGDQGLPRTLGTGRLGDPSGHQGPAGAGRDCIANPQDCINDGPRGPGNAGDRLGAPPTAGGGVSDGSEQAGQDRGRGSWGRWSPWRTNEDGTRSRSNTNGRGGTEEERLYGDGGSTRATSDGGGNSTRSSFNPDESSSHHISDSNGDTTTVTVDSHGSVEVVRTESRTSTDADGTRVTTETVTTTRVDANGRGARGAVVYTNRGGQRTVRVVAPTQVRLTPIQVRALVPDPPDPGQPREDPAGGSAGNDGCGWAPIHGCLNPREDVPTSVRQRTGQPGLNPDAEGTEGGTGSSGAPSTGPAAVTNTGDGSFGTERGGGSQAGTPIWKTMPDPVRGGPGGPATGSPSRRAGSDAGIDAGTGALPPPPPPPR
jgi:hypothetical protein